MCVEKGAKVVSVQLCVCTLHVNVCKALSLSLLCLGRWRLCLLSQCQGLLASPISLTISRPLEKVRWALDCLAQQILQGRGMSQAIPPWRIQGNNIPRNLSHPTQSYLGWDVAQALRNWHALCLLWSRGSWAGV